jgi:hypothetical protein
MTRPLPRLPRPAALLAALVLVGLAACAPQGRDPAISPVAVAPSRPAVPAAPGQTFSAPAPNQAVRDQAAIAAACRRDADRIITMRDRGQLMREDERDSRIGSEASIFARRAETDRLGRIFERDRLAEQCVQENTRAAPQR